MESNYNLRSNHQRHTIMAKAHIKLDKFDGVSDGVRWFEDLTSFIVLNKIEDGQRRDILKLYLKDGARTWLEAMPIDITWADLKKAFEARFQIKQYNTAELSTLLSSGTLKMLPDESVRSFVTCVSEILRGAKDQLTPQQIVNIIANGLPKSIRNHVVAQDPKSVNDIITTASLFSTTEGNDASKTLIARLEGIIDAKTEQIAAMVLSKTAADISTVMPYN
ncbi:unnamed protein product [Owenia fusiformis]|uniref:Uncharacterized protein n=1 Tax=Owenia fusiformis TaxID=6347 RepID=A0A8J1USZ4_OWEFU|nr:unnamed protein product [Owenia fusiformis]